MAQKQNSCTQIIVLQNLKQSTEEVSNMDTTKSESNEASMVNIFSSASKSCLSQDSA